MSLYSLRKLALFIIYGAHIAFTCALLLQPHFTAKKKEHKTLIVKTITPKPLPAMTARSIAKPAPSTSRSCAKKSSSIQNTPLSSTPKAPEKKELPKQASNAKKTVPAPASLKKTEPAIADKKLTKEKKIAPAEKEAPTRAKISDALLQELEESIAKIEQKADKKNNAQNPVRSTPLSLQIDTIDSNSDNPEKSSYAEMLVGHLRQTLQLPDYGDVKIQLSLRQDGSVVKITVLKAQSKENKRYLEESLPYIRFPRFEGSLASQKESSFILTFVNEM